MNIQEPLRAYRPKRASPHLNPNVQRWLHDLVKLPEGTLRNLANYLTQDYKVSNMNNGPEVDALITLCLLLTEMDKPTPAELPQAPVFLPDGEEDQMAYLGS